MESVSILLPADRLPVLLYDSPHSGRYYPADFETRATGAVLRRSEDAYVDDLILPALTCGAAVVVANYPRSYIDVNREPDDIDVALLAEPWPGPLRPSDKSQKGLGLIRRFVTPGVEVHAQPLTVSEVCRRIETVYEPYHRQLGALINRIRRDRGFVWHINWHSMKSVGHAMAPDGEGARRADVVVGDLDGRS
ncbi:MAG: N-formylglutamate amidohydrolase, partial [Acidobacteria bacterium]|nr:N-formylglutamate amidohydrolase [Acidobacteriota bacterium]